MANKTQPTGDDVMEFIGRFANTDQKKEDSYKLVELMRSISGYEPTMWGPSIIGFGSYDYKYDSGHEGNAPLIGFSPRKAAISLYVFTGLDNHAHLLEGLGKFKMGKACIYVKRLSDIDTRHLSVLMQETIDYLQKKYGQNNTET